MTPITDLISEETKNRLYSKVSHEDFVGQSSSAEGDPETEEARLSAFQKLTAFATENKDSIQNVANSILGKSQTPYVGGDSEPEKKTNWVLYAIIAVVVAIIVYFIFFRKK